MIAPWFTDLMSRGGRQRIVVGDYIDVTEPAALQRLADLEGAAISVFETRKGRFHPKCWLCRATKGADAALVGCSNLSKTAVTKGVEWNLHSETAADLVSTAFEALLAHPEIRALTPEWIVAYCARRRAQPLSSFAQAIVADEPAVPRPAPRPIQDQALAVLATG